MAATDAGGALTTRQREVQLQIRAQTLQDFMRLWPLWQVSDGRSFEQLVRATIPLIEMRRAVSADAAVDYFRAFRMVENGEALSPTPASTVDPDRVQASLQATGVAQARRSLAAGYSAEAARQTALTTMSGAVSRHVLDGGRRTIEQAIEDDDAALGYIRVTDGDPCAFCAMLAARGPIYLSRASGATAGVGRLRGTRGRGQSYHDHCACTVEPQYLHHDDWRDRFPDNARFREIYEKAQRDAREEGGPSSGTSNPALNNFRRVYERGRS